MSKLIDFIESTIVAGRCECIRCKSEAVEAHNHVFNGIVHRRIFAGRSRTDIIKVMKAVMKDALTESFPKELLNNFMPADVVEKFMFLGKGSGLILSEEDGNLILNLEDE